MEQVKTKVYNVFMTKFKLQNSELNDDLGPGDLPRWDSLTQLQLISQFETEFNVTLSVNEVMDLNSIKDFIKILSSKSNAAVNDQPQDKQISSIFYRNSLILPKEVVFSGIWHKNLNLSSNDRVVIITSSASYANKIIDEGKSEFKGLDFICLSRRSQEPRINDINQLKREVVDFNPQTIIAIGGGSTIDLAKILWLSYEYPDKNLSEFHETNSFPNLGYRSKFISVPTTFGSGAEVSSAAVYYDENEKSKKIIFSHSLMSSKVILDPGLGLSLPKKVLFSSGIDALTHSIEGYVSTISNPQIEPYAINSSRLIIQSLKGLINSNASFELLKDLCYSSYFAGIVQNHCSVGLTHSISHSLSQLNIDHGVGNGMFLVPVMIFNSAQNNIYDNLSKYVGFQNFDEMILEIDNIIRRSEILPNKEKLKEIYENLELVSEKALNDITIRTNPVEINSSNITEVFKIFKERYID